MTTRAQVGIGDASDAHTAGLQAAQQAIAGLGTDAALLLVFGTAGYDQQRLLDGVRRAGGKARIAGCTGEGVIASGRSLEQERAVAVMAIASDHIRFEPLLLPGYGEDPVGSGRKLGALVAERSDAFGVWLLADGLTGDCSSFLAAFDDCNPRRVPVIGGTSADSFTFEQTHQYCDDVVATGAACAVVLRGAGSMRIAVSHGCLPIGRPRTITRMERGWVFEIDGEPAWDVFREYLDGDPIDLNAEGIVQLCIGKQLPPELAGDYAPYVIRTPLQLDRATGALFFPGGGLAEGQQIQLTRRDPRVIETSAAACGARIAEQAAGAQPALVVQFDCAGRGSIMFGHEVARYIIEPLQRTLGARTPWIGFHTYGEVAPIGGSSFYHNYSVALCAVFDPPGANT